MHESFPKSNNDQLHRLIAHILRKTAEAIFVLPVAFALYPLNALAGSFHIERFYNFQSQAMADCQKIATDYNYSSNFCHAFATSPYPNSSITEAGWLCTSGPPGSNGN